MGSYIYAKSESFVKDNSGFKLHSHSEYEMYLFLSGDADYIVEGTIYPLSPCDLIIMRADELHKPFHKSPSHYTRATIHLTGGFFSEMNCEEYKKAFTNRKSGQGNKIPASVVRESGLFDAFNRLDKYSGGGGSIKRAVIVEALHILNSVTPQSSSVQQNLVVKDIILYLNDNLTHNISLDSLAEKFFISKYHMCRIFRNATGHTIGSYVTYKRLLLAKEMHESGKTLGTACLDCGFGSYSSFYKAYIKTFGTPPKRLKKQTD
jgi:AraC-like DNA-binding protein